MYINREYKNIFSLLLNKIYYFNIGKIFIFKNIIERI